METLVTGLIAGLAVGLTVYLGKWWSMPKKAPCGCYEFPDISDAMTYTRWVDKILYVVVDGFHYKVHRDSWAEHSACGREFTPEELMEFLESRKPSEAYDAWFKRPNPTEER